MRSAILPVLIVVLTTWLVPSLSSAEKAAQVQSQGRSWRPKLRLKARWRLARRKLRPVRHKLAVKCHQLKTGCQLATSRLRESTVVRIVSTRGRRLKAGYLRTKERVTSSPLYQKAHAKKRRLKARYRLARQKFKKSRIGRGLYWAGMQVSGRMTLLGDRIELNVSPRLRPWVRGLRNLNPIAFGSYAAYKFKRDPAFLGAYGAFSLYFSNIQFPVLLGMGFSLPATIGIRILTGTPVDLGVLWWREHHKLRKKDPTITPMGTLSSLGQEYRTYQDSRREKNRQYMHQRQRHPHQQRPSPPLQKRQLGTLRSLAAPLVERPAVR